MAILPNYDAIRPGFSGKRQERPAAPKLPTNANAYALCPTCGRTCTLEHYTTVRGGQRLQVVLFRCRTQVTKGASLKTRDRQQACPVHKIEKIESEEPEPMPKLTHQEEVALRAAMRDRNLTQAAVERMVGATKNSLSAMLAGKVPVSNELKAKFFEATGATVPKSPSVAVYDSCEEFSTRKPPQIDIYDAARKFERAARDLFDADPKLFTFMIERVTSNA